MSRSMPEQEARDTALLDGQLQPSAPGEADLADLADDGGEGFTFERFFHGPAAIFLFPQIEEKQSVRRYAIDRKSRREARSFAGDPKTRTAILHQRGKQTAEEPIGGGGLLGSVADEFMDRSRRKGLIRESSRDRA